ncbi:MAG: hypothetical protein LBV26_08220 [Bacteroidales bacterium]|jgi:signal transduction histidine kinase|nr:hypothetical protein [Bacteroidales bacterium]
MTKKLAISFFVIFAAFTTAIVIFEQQRVRSYKTEILIEKLDVYAGQVLAKAPAAVFPPELRITLIDRDGTVLSDNKANVSQMENHLTRREIAEAIRKGKGSDIRNSTSNNRPYLYYAKDNGTNVIVRVAIPYDITVRSFLKPDNTFLYFVMALFLAGLGFIWYFGRNFGRSEQRLHQFEIQEKNRRLKQELTGNIAHELRTPVTSIRGFLEIVLENDLTVPRAQEYLQRAYCQTLNLSELISDMSLLSRLDEKQDTFRFSEVDIEKLLNRVQADTAARLAERGISFTAELPEGLVVQGNEGLLYSVFRNLTDNVIAHAGNNVEIRIRAVRKADGMVEFSFADTGVGIADKYHLERIFERFYRVGEGRTRDTGGSGLGLSIVKNAVQFHGGTISARNTAPHGLEFVFHVG